MRSYWRGKNTNFYKELYEKKKGNPAEYRRFLSQLNVEDLREEGLVVPDLYDTFEIYGKRHRSLI